MSFKAKTIDQLLDKAIELAYHSNNKILIICFDRTEKISVLRKFSDKLCGELEIHAGQPYVNGNKINVETLESSMNVIIGMRFTHVFLMPEVNITWQEKGRLLAAIRSRHLPSEPYGIFTQFWKEVVSYEEF